MMTSISRSAGPIVAAAGLLIMFVYIFANMGNSFFGVRTQRSPAPALKYLEAPDR